MFKLNDPAVCDYCQEQYLNDLELEAHIYFHNDDQDIERLVSSLSQYDDSYMLPKALKLFSNGQMSRRILELKKEDLLNPNRPMSDRIEELVELCNKYPLTKSSPETEENSDSPDKSDNEEAPEDDPDGNRQ